MRSKDIEPVGIARELIPRQTSIQSPGSTFPLGVVCKPFLSFAAVRSNV
jgi:hypothetical protein